VKSIPRIGISIGDPAGIGPEVTLKALTSSKSIPRAHFILYGSRSVLEKELEILSLPLTLLNFEESADTSAPSVSLVDIPAPQNIIDKGTPQEECGALSFSYFETAFQHTRQGRLQALVTAPISKHSWSLAGIPWAGHTEYIHKIYPRAIMFFWSEELKVALFSHHLPLQKALDRIERNALKHFFLGLQDSLLSSSGFPYRFLVAGLNPHAGEQGLLGSEEKKEIFPAVQDAQKKGMDISGPYPPDIVFRKALEEPRTVVIALYHDQGLIPFKLQSFDRGVNVTLGLPFIRTSPDHGTAFDIAGQDKANPRSMIEAIGLACSLSQPL
jgi:4-hydroxythreonine-4-phosphate dehydrogenase